MRLLSCLFLLFALSAAAGAQEKKMDPPLLTVAGEGEVRVDPDLATVRLGVMAQADTARAAQEQVNQVAQKLRDRLRDLKVPTANLQTSQLEISPVYTNPRPPRPNEAEGVPRVVGYRAQNLFTIRLEDLTMVGPVIDAGVAVGANQLQGVQFGLRNETPARLRALREAVGSARQKAEAIANALDLRITGIQSVAEGGAQVVPPPFQARAFSLEGAAGGTPVEPGQLSISAQVTLRYQIQPR
jgi:uncharacterized protein YggE